VRPDCFIGFRAAPADEATMTALDIHLETYLVPEVRRSLGGPPLMVQKGLQRQLLPDHMQMVRRSGGPRVKAVATKAAMTVDTATQCRNEPVEPKVRS
jgi:hypothetical protein